MGGFAAKQRRRLERQSLQPPNGYYNDDDKDEKKSSPKSKMKRNERKDSHQGAYQSPKKVATSPKDKHDSTLPTKKKIQKPKHLKRKLESINNVHGESSNINQEKEQLLKQMEELERRKRQKNSSTQNVTTNKRKTIKVEKVQKTQMDDVKGMTHQAINKKQKQDTPTLSHSSKQKSKAIVKETNEVDLTNQAVVDTITSNVCESKVENKSNIINAFNSKNDNIDQSKNSVINAPNNNGGIIGDGENNKSGDDDDDDDDDDDVLIGKKNIRQRGKRLRRRGQNNSDEKSTETNQDAYNEKIVTDITNNNNIPDGTGESPNIETTTTPVRRCIGRKPVTEYVIGQCYSGTVVYVKPFGVFLDIGCHSDAFCHVSQLSDEYIESAIDLYPIGSKIDNRIRVVSIDRKKKQLTVSLKQGDDMTKNLGATSHVNDLRANIGSNNFTDDINGKNNNAIPTTTKSTVIEDNHKANESQAENTQNVIHTLSDAEQAKRARKIARRAMRRNEKEITNGTNE
jgi:predicted RNA-binding protein with RPS1 domain